ncbi:MAG: phosphoglucosamine mutase [Candidatus Pacebacteria bacterium]|nr:phosphoglucosamine mutase [Candidatus Paceibacterota bacterium]
MLIASISGIRGTLGEHIGKDLTRTDVRHFVSAYAEHITQKKGKKKVVLGRDARPSGTWIKKEAIDVLTSYGINIVDVDLVPTPTVEFAVIREKADGGIVISASHNPAQYNGLKFLNEHGEFVSASVGKKILALYTKARFPSKKIKKGKVVKMGNYIDHHIRAIGRLPLVQKNLIKKANFTVAVDGINSVGGIAIPKLLRFLGVTNIVEIHTKPTGIFAHTPEPLPENLTELASIIKKTKADVGIAVDPDADRGVLFTERGDCFGEEYSLVAVADYVLSKKKGNAVSNIASSVALRDVALARGGKYFSSPVGEANVVKEVKKRKALIGGEGGSGVGVIYPPLHYGRDSLVGVALFLSMLAQEGGTVSDIRERLPQYEMVKEKISCPDSKTVERIMKFAGKLDDDARVDTRDGIRIDYEDCWISFRKSNTEPIIRIYTEAPTKRSAQMLADIWKKKLLSLL